MKTDPWTYDGLTYRRRPTRVVRVGDVELGGENPIRIQSMTTPATRDTAATVAQIERLVDAGCEIVRVTVPTNADADGLPRIREELARRAIRVPLVADIHFTPAVAMKAVEHVDKIRVNPGNFADKKRFAVREYDDAEYRRELDRIERIFSPLVLRAKELGVSMRIGANHGSLSDRIMNRFGDTPEGMVESALEFVRICRTHDYHDLVLSMKASNPVVVLQVYRLLASRMAAEEMDYPFHLGVTEAGEGEDGRVKSAIGIGVLLAEGIGDTIRVSLTEDPVAEIPVARALAAPFDALRSARTADPVRESPAPVLEGRDPYRYERRRSGELRIGPHLLGAAHPVRVEVPLHSDLEEGEAQRRELDREAGVRVAEEVRAEIACVRARAPRDLPAVEKLRKSVDLVAPRVALSVTVPFATVAQADRETASRWCAAAHRLHVVLDRQPGPTGVRQLQELLAGCAAASTALLVESAPESADVRAAVETAVRTATLAKKVPGAPLMLAVDPALGGSPLYAVRLLAARLDGEGLDTPLLLLDRPSERGADPLLGSSLAMGGLLCDGIGDAIQIDAAAASESRNRAFGVLQAARVRITRTEFISCPSCGRTLFDLEQTTARIRARTDHLKGVKIAIMGCVVNGPGEMADADFGYVGWGEDKIALFVGKEMVAKDIPTAEADERLVELIRQHGRWVDP
jgi:(E)-4-hydroxy-3-methylbut-2-enyl-diphosphate synthase